MALSCLLHVVQIVHTVLGILCIFRFYIIYVYFASFIFCHILEYKCIFVCILFDSFEIYLGKKSCHMSPVTDNDANTGASAVARNMYALFEGQSCTQTRTVYTDRQDYIYIYPKYLYLYCFVGFILL
jgi:hypothetical protein